MTEPKNAASPADPILSRIEGLERENRRMKWLLAAAFVGAVVVTTRGGDFLRKNRKHVEAQSFVLVDAQGQPRGKLGFQPDGSPALALYNAQGNDQIVLEAGHQDSGTLAIYNQNQTRVHLAASDDGSAAFRMIGREPSAQTSMFLWPDSTAGLAMSHLSNGIMMGVQPDGLSGIAVVDEDGVERGRLGALPPEVKPLGLTRLDGKAPFRVDDGGPFDSFRDLEVVRQDVTPIHIDDSVPTRRAGASAPSPRISAAPAVPVLAEDLLETFTARPAARG